MRVVTRAVSGSVAPKPAAASQLVGSGWPLVTPISGSENLVLPAGVSTDVFADERNRRCAGDGLGRHAFGLRSVGQILATPALRTLSIPGLR